MMIRFHVSLVEGVSDHRTQYVTSSILEVLWFRSLLTFWSTICYMVMYGSPYVLLKLRGRCRFWPSRRRLIPLWKFSFLSPWRRRSLRQSSSLLDSSCRSRSSKLMSFFDGKSIPSSSSVIGLLPFLSSWMVIGGGANVIRDLETRSTDLSCTSIATVVFWNKLTKYDPFANGASLWRNSFRSLRSSRR